MKRNIEKAIKEGRAISRKREGLDIHPAELLEFESKVKERYKETGNKTEAIMEAVIDAYYCGVAVGYRNGRPVKAEALKAAGWSAEQIAREME